VCWIAVECVGLGIECAVQRSRRLTVAGLQGARLLCTRWS